MLKIFVCHFLTKLHPFFTYEGGKSKKVFFWAYLMMMAMVKMFMTAANHDRGAFYTNVAFFFIVSFHMSTVLAEWWIDDR